MTEQMNPTALNTEAIVLWFDDLGTGNEKYRFLSNFYQGEPITLPGVTWAALAAACGRPELANNFPEGDIPFKTGEHAFAAMKFWGTDFTHFADITFSQDPNTAKALGRSRQHPLRPDWEVVKLDVMAAITRAKYAPERDEAHLLTGTVDRLLVEGTFWHDEVWGVALDTPGLSGRNWLGTLLMARRAELLALDFNSDTVTHFVTNTVQHNTDFAKGL